MNPIKVAVVDDHILFGQALKTLISSFEDTYVVYTASNGQELINYLENKNEIPDVVLLDVRMPVMNGKQTMQWLQKNHPTIKVIALTMEDDEDTIIRMLHYGCKGYLLKDVDPPQLKEAINQVNQGLFVYSDIVNRHMREKAITSEIEPVLADQNFSEKERTLIKYICGTDLGYREIAEKMNLSPKTIDNRRADLFHKLGVNSRVSAVLYAIKHELI